VQGQGVLTLAGTQSPLEVFVLGASQVATTQRLAVSNVRSDAHIVINVSADAVRRLSVALDTASLSAWKGRVLVNAHDAETVQFNQVTLWSSVLAPNACICNSTGRLEGSVVARKWSASMSITYTPFVPKP
jgi:choice-of-anchor A domain-containing protein